MNKLAALNRLKERYWRPVIAFPNGNLTHHGDCDIYRSIDHYGTAPCTCGLLHDLRGLEMPNKIYSNYYEDDAKGYPKGEITEEEFAKAKALLEKAFGKPQELTSEQIVENIQEECEHWDLIQEVFGKEYRDRTLRDDPKLLLNLEYKKKLSE